SEAMRAGMRMEAREGEPAHTRRPGTATRCGAGHGEPPNWKDDMTTATEDLTTIALELDGVPVQARAGERILDVARRHGIDVPTLCDGDRLRPAGNCRACVVEIEGERVLAPSCCRNVE